MQLFNIFWVQQNDVSEKRKLLRKSNMVMIKADKTDNFYSMECGMYQKKLKEDKTANKLSFGWDKSNGLRVRGG